MMIKVLMTHAKLKNDFHFYIFYDNTFLNKKVNVSLKNKNTKKNVILCYLFILKEVK